MVKGPYKHDEDDLKGSVPLCPSNNQLADFIQIRQTPQNNQCADFHPTHANTVHHDLFQPPCPSKGVAVDSRARPPEFQEATYPVQQFEVYPQDRDADRTVDE